MRGKAIYSLCLSMLAAVSAVGWIKYFVIGGTMTSTWRGINDLNGMIGVALGVLSWHFFTAAFSKRRGARWDLDNERKGNP